MVVVSIGQGNEETKKKDIALAMSFSDLIRNKNNKLLLMFFAWFVATFMFAFAGGFAFSTIFFVVVAAGFFCGVGFGIEL